MTSLEKLTLQQLVKKQSPLQKFFSEKVSEKELNKVKKKTVEVVIDVDGSGDNIEEIGVLPPDDGKLGTCQGVFPDYHGLLKALLCAYCLHASIHVKSNYKIDYVCTNKGKFSQFFSKSCKGGQGTYRTHKTGKIFSCGKCESIRLV